MAKTDGLDIDPGSLFDSMQVALFDSMDRLSEMEVSSGIMTPQLVVVGAQSSGKSSLLEALVRFRFPVDSATKGTTRFPIKLVLRKADREATRVRIEPEGSRSPKPLTDLSDDTFDDIIRKVQAVLEVSPSGTPGEICGNTQKFWSDVLVIERDGPSIPNLSLVDLPGLFHAEDPEHTLEDMCLVDNMVSEYIKSPGNIIVLVVSAEFHDYGNSPIVGKFQRMLKDDTSLKERVICVLTRPDKASSQDATQKILGKENRFSQSFLRPWHVVRNQDQEERKNHQSLDKRDEAEKEFFNTPSWKAVPPGQKGIAALRETLKSMIWSHTQEKLPEIIKQVEDTIKEGESLLGSSIRARATPDSRRMYLGDIAEKFARLTREAVNGTYENERCDKDHEAMESCQDCEGFFAGFGNNKRESQQKRLRGNIRALNLAFATAMRQYGKTKVEIEAEIDPTLKRDSRDTMSRQQEYRERFQPDDTIEYYDHQKPEPQGRSEYENWVRTNMDRWKAKGPVGEPSERAYSGLFAHQAEKWGKIASQHLKAVWQVVEEFIGLALVASCPDGDVLAELRYRLVNPNLKTLQLKASRTLRDIASCHSQSNSGFYDSFVEARAVREHTTALLQRLAVMAKGSEDGTEANEPSTTPRTEQTNARQGSVQRPGDPKVKAQQVNSQRSGEQKAKDRDQDTREAMLIYALETVTSTFVGGVPFLNNARVRRAIIPIIANQISTAFDFNGASDGKENASRMETSIPKTIQDLFPPKFEDVSAARVIGQVEMHYEERILSSNPIQETLTIFLGNPCFLHWLRRIPCC